MRELAVEGGGGLRISGGSIEAGSDGIGNMVLQDVIWYI